MRVRTTEQRIEISSGGGGLMVLGALLMLGGGFFAWALLTDSSIAQGVTVNGRPGRPGDAWLPVLIALVGAALAGFRWRSEIDFGARQYVRYRRFWFRASTRRDPLGEPLKVTLQAERRGSGKNNRTVYAVKLVTNEREIEVASPGDERSGRAHAESVARMGNVPLHDLRGSDPLVRQPEDLDRSVLDSADPDRAPRPVALPSPCRVRIRPAGAGTEFRVPAPAAWLLLLAIVPMALPTAFFAFVWFPRATPSTGAPVAVVWIFWIGLPLVMCVAPVAVVMTAALRGGLLPRRIVVERGTLHVGRTAFQATDLEELHVTTGSLPFFTHLRAASDHSIRRIGRGLSTDELEYLRYSLLEALAASR